MKKTLEREWSFNSCSGIQPLPLQPPSLGRTSLSSHSRAELGVLGTSTRYGSTQRQQCLCPRSSPGVAEDGGGCHNPRTPQPQDPSASITRQTRCRPAPTSDQCKCLRTRPQSRSRGSVGSGMARAFCTLLVPGSLQHLRNPGQGHPAPWVLCALPSDSIPLGFFPYFFHF